MEIFRCKMYNGEVNIIFTGECYYFLHGFYGLFAYAQRDYTTDTPDLRTFTIYVDQSNSKGGDWVGFVSLVKQIVKQYESRYVQCSIYFTVNHLDIYNYGIDVNMFKYGLHEELQKKG